MNVSILKGTGVALVTPFNEDYSIDYQGLNNLLTHTYQEGKGVEYWVVQGTTGESPTLSPTEKGQVLDFVRNNNPHQVPIVYGIGGNNTQSVIENIKKNNFDKVTALLSVTPYYNKPSQNGLIAHYRAIADVSPVPVILYNVPGRTGINLKAETTLALAEHQNIIAVKEASGDLVQCMEIVKYKSKDFLLLSGDDLITPAMISFGAEGVISVLANAFPYQFSEMTRQALANNFQKSSQYLFNFLKINPLMYEESNPVGVKEALAQLNVCKNIVRLPLLASSKNLSERIKKVREENGL